MSQKVIQIDESLCIGCGLCTQACQEGAIALVDGVAKLIKEDHCDGLGNCLPECPVGALKLVERQKVDIQEGTSMACGCSSHLEKPIIREKREEDVQERPSSTELNQWPVQLKLISESASYLKGADLLIASDCSAFSYGNFHQDFMKDKITVIACPKLDGTDYSEKISNIIINNDIKSITVARMEVPCCGGLVQMVKKALELSGKVIPWQIATISTDGRILK